MSLVSLYDEASLWMTPSGAKDGKLFSELPTDGSGDFTFSRGSNLAATRVGPTGLIEKGRENLLVQSNQFDSIGWLYSGTNVTSGQNGYDGTNDAWLLTKTTASFNYIYQNISQSGVKTLSLYAKAGTLGGVRLFVNFASGNSNVYFNLNNGTSFSIDPDAIDAKIESVGNGWYRCSITDNEAITQVRIYPITDTGDFNVNGNILIQDAQLEIGLAATDYIESGATTGKAGLLEDEPRLDYSGGATCPSLLLEPSRTNSIISSEYIDSWDKNAFSVDTNSATSPEGVVNASKIIPSTNNTGHYIDRLGFNRTANQYIAHSVYVKPDGYNYFSLSNAANRLIANFELTGEGSARYVSSNGTDFTNHSASIEAVGNGWYRCILIGQALNSVATYMRISCGSSAYDSSSWNGAGDGTSGVLMYGAQVELNASYPTSYIPNHSGTGSVTRGADVCNSSENSVLFNKAEGVLFLESSALAEGTDRRISISDGTTNNYISIGYSRFTGNIIAEVFYNGVSQQPNWGATGITQTDNNKFALSWGSGIMKFYVNGVLKLTDSVTSPIGLDILRFSAGNGSLRFIGETKQVIVFPTALTDSECIKLTTL